MLYYNFKNYDEFKNLFGIIKHGNNTQSRKSKILLVYLKDKALLHLAAINNDYTLLHISDMAELEKRMEKEIIQSGTEDAGLPYELHLMNKTYHSFTYATDEYQGLCEDGDSKAVRYYNHKTGKVFKMKAGKLYRHLILETKFGKTLPEQVITYLCEVFAEKWQTFTMNRLPRHRLHVNRNFERLYSSECCDGDFCSCMVDKGYHGFYKNSVNASAAYLENEEGKIIARCIIYNEVKDQDGKVWRLAERQYSSGNNEILKRALVDALAKERHIDGYKKVGAGCHEARNFVDLEGNSLSDRRFRISCDLDWDDDLSYQDSFKYYNDSTRIADNYEEGYLVLDVTEGSLNNADDNQLYDDYHEYSCDETTLVYVHGCEYNCDSNNLGDFVWVNDLEQYHHVDDVIFCNNCECCVLKEDSYYSGITKKDYCCEHCKEKAEKEYKEENWHWSDYNSEYYKDKEDIVYYHHWNWEKGEYEEKTISIDSLRSLLYTYDFFEFDNEYFDTVNPATNLPYGYKLIQIVA
jgi:hypothetical protein